MPIKIEVWKLNVVVRLFGFGARFFLCCWCWLAGPWKCSLRVIATIHRYIHETRMAKKRTFISKRSTEQQQVARQLFWSEWEKQNMMYYRWAAVDWRCSIFCIKWLSLYYDYFDGFSFDIISYGIYHIWKLIEPIKHRRNTTIEKKMLWKFSFDHLIPEK